MRRSDVGCGETAVQKFVWVALLLLGSSLLGACSTGAYLWQATKGHISVLAASQKIDDVIAAPATPEKLQAKLAYVKRVRTFSIQTLGLPDNRSYTSYAQLNRPFVVWNVIASPADSLNLKTWCFPFTGCISYKGFYREQDAMELGDSLRAEGLDVAVLGVPAYSTLGFTPDPVLSTFVNYPEGELARLIFHELAHQVVYINDDTMFNESFATAVEELGVDIWLNQEGHEAIRSEYQLFDERRVAFRELLARAQDDLRMIYEGGAVDQKSSILKKKQRRLLQLQSDYKVLKESWGGWAGYDKFMLEDLNNAKLGVSGLYTQHVSAFKALFLECESDFLRFYSAVESLGELEANSREITLKNLREGSSDITCL